MAVTTVRVRGTNSTASLLKRFVGRHSNEKCGLFFRTGAGWIQGHGMHLRQLDKIVRSSRPTEPLERFEPLFQNDHAVESGAAGVKVKIGPANGST